MMWSLLISGLLAIGAFWYLVYFVATKKRNEEYIQKLKAEGHLNEDYDIREAQGTSSIKRTIVLSITTTILLQVVPNSWLIPLLVVALLVFGCVFYVVYFKRDEAMNFIERFRRKE